MARLIDSSVLIEMERRNLRLPDLLREEHGERGAIVAITVSELLHGVYRADSPTRRYQREAFLEGILEAIPVLPFDLNAARMHARLWSEMTAVGQRIGAHDMLIAATAIARGFDVVTLNVREFQRVPGLVVLQPTWS